MDRSSLRGCPQTRVGQTKSRLMFGNRWFWVLCEEGVVNFWQDVFSMKIGVFDFWDLTGNDQV